MSQGLQAFVERQLKAPCPPPARAFAKALAGETGAHAVLFYGSILRTGDLDGVLDFYLLTGDERRTGWRGWIARRLWPDVSYRELEIGGRVLRAKIATMPLSTFGKAAAGGYLDTTIWTRFVQPCALTCAADAASAAAVKASICAAAETAARYAAALGPESGRAGDFWLALFRRTYAAELRVEKPGREREIIRFDPGRWNALLPLAWRSAGVDFEASGETLRPQLREAERRRLHRAWARRTMVGKPLNAARLVKAASTFEGAARYAAWKIARHTGVVVPVTAWRERHPILAAPGVAWRLWRARGRR
ncbi:MAG TPA: hypothetical protein VJS38_16080 [Phenylobacterium sp.]|uniref:hypothetical protein n=1 Tax=Phenylobacterium sp. TaxID=1871053 RepID=UPI002B4659E4|nr:hypothetical protein [Phenylobacterium sp.]HKR89690.1 hypothetical protein [Phenylobacterium sp.]